MSQASVESIPNQTVVTLTAEELQALSDRLFARGISTISTASAAERQDLVLASRALRRLLAAYERASNRRLSALIICGGM
jgi:hypothetical protein